MITHKIIVFKYNQKVFYSSYKDLANDRGDNIHQAASPFSVLGALLPSICTIITLSCLSKLSPVSNPFHNGLPPHSTSIPLPFPFRGLIIVYHCERLIMRFSYTFCIKWINDDGDDNDDDDTGRFFHYGGPNTTYNPPSHSLYPLWLPAMEATKTVLKGIRGMLAS